jgi:hypothetical protein
MSSAGHILEMITRMKNNEALKKGKREKRRKLYEMFDKTGTQHHHEEIRDSNVSKEELEKIKEKIQDTAVKDNKSARINSILFSALVILALAAFIYWILRVPL